MTAVFTIDTLLALFITFTILAISLNLVSDWKATPDERLLFLGRDLLSVLEEKDILNELVESQQSNYDYFSKSIGPQYCVDMTIMDEDGFTIYNDGQCTTTKIQAYRSFSYKDNLYLALIEVGLNG